MKFIHYDYTFEFVPPVMKRGEHVLVALITKAGKVLLGRKNFYPTNIVRLIGGGMDQGEKPREAAIREVEEELGVKLDPKSLKKIARITADFYETSTKHEFAFITHLYSASLTVDSYKAADDLDGVVEYTRVELAALIDRYAKLSTAVWTDGTNYGTFRWSDYGEFYGELHKLVLEAGIVR